MKLIKDKNEIPDFFNNKRYDNYYKNYNILALTHEVQERQSVSGNINLLFDEDYLNLLAEEELQNRKIIEEKLLNKENITLKQYKEYAPSFKTAEEIIEDDKSNLQRRIKNFAEPRYIQHPSLGEIRNSNKLLAPFPRLFWDDRPYIQPVKEIKNTIEDQYEYALRKNVDAYEDYPTFSMNLDFSDDAILTEIKKHLIKLRKERKHRAKLLPPKEFIKKFKTFRTLQVIDILLWQKLIDQHIEYEIFANFLFPYGQFSGKQLRETVIPFAKKLLDRHSKESTYLFYLSDQKGFVAQTYL